ncbi:Unconventional myosin-XV [Amphibalanus amphitrite]|uniref:Unconventional myosin-XV n=1 Tax=Amphibalanus amphitrite TaxID=1232801 RepID=A0A6A4VDZ5_AMPAM|nr:Unconventional myosin-XV [Amphibalanus amphitrite]
MYNVNNILPRFTELFILEESEGFLRPVDSYRQLAISRDLESVRTLEAAKTRLFPPSDAPFVTYNRVSWKLDVRKEVFSPTEDVTNATALHLVFCQIVQDVFNPACIRISHAERAEAKQKLDDLGVTSANMQATQLKLSVKRQVLELARQWPTYFCMLFPVSGGRNNPLVQFLGVSHSGVRLLRREKAVPNDFLKVIDHVPFDEIGSVTEHRGSSVQLVLKNGARQAFHTSKASTLTDMLERFVAESQSAAVARRPTWFTVPEDVRTWFTVPEDVRTWFTVAEDVRTWFTVPEDVRTWYEAVSTARALGVVLPLYSGLLDQLDPVTLSRLIFQVPQEVVRSLGGLELADGRFSSDRHLSVDLLVGLDQYWQLLKDGLLRTSAALFEVERWGSLRKATRVVAWVKRFVFNCRNPGLRRQSELSGDEIAEARTALVRDAQQAAFPEEGSHEYVRATADYTSHDPSLLSFMKGDLIRVIKKSQPTEKGWLFGLLDGRRGTFPAQFVTPVGKNSSRSQSKISITNGSNPVLAAAAGSPVPTDAWSTRPPDDPRLEVESDSDLSTHSPAGGDASNEGLAAGHKPTQDDGKHSLLQYAMLHFRDAEEKYNMLREEGGATGSIKLEKKKGKKKGKEDWTWREQVEMVKWSDQPLQASLLKLESAERAGSHGKAESGELNRQALDCFLSIQRYMGDQPMAKDMAEVDCVYTILMACHRAVPLRDEVYCQLMRQTTSNKSTHPDSCQRGWRLFSIVAAYFSCSDGLRPYLFKYLETAAYDKRRAYHGTAMVCLQNLRKTFRFGGRKNVPSIEEITAITAGRNSKRQIYRLPGGTERVINTRSTSVVQDIIEDICSVIKIRTREEMDEFSLYCIVEGDTFTMPLAREEYILDVTTELQKNEQHSRHVSKNEKLLELTFATESQPTLPYRLPKKESSCECASLGDIKVEKIFLSGSVREGTHVRVWSEMGSDIDAMFHLDCTTVLDTVPEQVEAAGCQASSGSCELRVEPTSNLGYVLLKHPRRESCHHQEELTFGADCAVNLLDVFRARLDASGESRREGPALNTQVPDYMQHTKNTDLVPCLTATGVWPGAAFVSRARRSGQPSPELVFKLSELPIFLVPVGFPGSPTQGDEWRVSFSKHEYILLRLMLESQRACLTLLKTCKAILGLHSLKSYHLKTALMWLCETRPTSLWTCEGTQQSVLEIIKFLEDAISRRNLPCYFWPDINILATRSDAELSEISHDVHQLKVHLLSCSLALITHWLSGDVPLVAERLLFSAVPVSQTPIFYLIFCRSVWYFPLRLESHLYVEVVFNQIAPDYLEGLLLVMPGETLHEEVVYDISRVAALLHRAADMSAVPTMKETKYLLPKAALMVRDIKPPQWVNMVQDSWSEVHDKTPMEAKAAVLEILERWPLFGSSFFAVSRVTESREAVDHILALNRGGVHFLDSVTHETLARYPFSEVISTRKVKTEEGTLFLDMKYGNLMQQKVVSIQSDNAHEISRLIRQYISIEQKHQPSQRGAEEAREGPGFEVAKSERTNVDPPISVRRLNDETREEK